jgi:hypothetical protein
LSSNSTNISEQGQLLALLAAANTLSPNKIHIAPMPMTTLRDNQIVSQKNFSLSNLFLTCEAKTEMVYMALMDEPIIIGSNPVNDASTMVGDTAPLQNIVFSHQSSSQPSLMASLSLIISLESSRAPKKASLEVSIQQYHNL